VAIVAMPPKLATIPSHAVLIDLTAGSEHLLSPDASPAHGTSEALEDAGNQNIPSWSRQQSPCSVLSVASSGRLFAEPQQTLLFLDWDDTMFPCTELFYKRGLPKRSKDWTPPDPELLAALEPWQRAVKEFLGRACAVSDRCVILTNSRKPWVTSCLGQFAPELKSAFEGSDGPIIVYAPEVLKEKMKQESDKNACWECFKPYLNTCCGGLAQFLENEMSLMRERVPQPFFDCTQAKLTAMKREAAEFYSQYPGQTWKNIISLGDMFYEHEAVKTLQATRVPQEPRERLRTKSFVLCPEPSLAALTLQLRVWSLLLPLCARFDGDVDLDLGRSPVPFEDLAAAFNLPQLSRLQLPAFFRSARRRKSVEDILDPRTDSDELTADEHRAAEEFLDELTIILQDAVLIPKFMKAE